MNLWAKSILTGRVSILVFLELALGLALPPSRWLRWKVSILVFLELALGQYQPGRPPCRVRRVSILVFLELALGRRTPGCLANSTSCFNPCFLGTCPRTRNPGWHHLLKCCFNPCFLGTCPRTYDSVAKCRISDRVSILVFLELALGLIDMLLCYPCSAKFQSLFSWNLPSDSFEEVNSFYKFRFQSLFSWNLPSDQPLSSILMLLLWVSILVFLELALGPTSQAMADINKLSFNPCFLGTCPRTLPCPCQRSTRYLVSILVFLELALGRRTCLFWFGCLAVSILVFLELALGL